MSKDISFSYERPMDDESKERFRKFSELYWYSIEKSKTEFENLKRKIEQELEELHNEGKISSKVKILSRIKSASSAAEKMLRGEGSYDIFGITVLTENESEIAVLEEVLGRMNITSMNRRNEKRGYKATHFQFKIGKLRIECHLQTAKNYDEGYPHGLYKSLKRKRTMDGEGLTREDEGKIIAKMKVLYMSGELQGIVLSNGKKSGVPEMWETCFDNNGKMKERKLSELEALKIAFFPCLEGIEETQESPGGDEPDL